MTRKQTAFFILTASLIAWSAPCTAQQRDLRVSNTEWRFGLALSGLGASRDDPADGDRDVLGIGFGLGAAYAYYVTETLAVQGEVAATMLPLGRVTTDSPTMGEETVEANMTVVAFIGAGVLARIPSWDMLTSASLGKIMATDLADLDGSSYLQPEPDLGLRLFVGKSWSLTPKSDVVLGLTSDLARLSGKYDPDERWTIATLGGQVSFLLR